MKENQEKASTFLVKLLNMLRSKENAKTITWDVDQSGIRILNQQKLEETLLPRYFRHNRFSSFVRQLNMYDFHKLYLPDNSSVFYHSIFNPRDKQSVYKIKRKAPPLTDQNTQINKNPKVKTLFKSAEPVKERSASKPTRKKEDNNSKSSFKLIFKNSVNNLRDKNEEESEAEQALSEIINHIAPLQLTEGSVKQKISQLRSQARFKRFLKRSTFLKQIYLKLGLEMDNDDDQLSELSIEEQLMFNTKKSLTLRSLKMFESGPINLKDTLGMLLS